MKLSSTERRLLETQRAWRDAAQSMRVGPFRITPTSGGRLPGKDDRQIVLIPSFTYGSGGNQLTQLALSQVPDLVSKLDRRRDRVLDLGCGSGVLAIACAKLGLERVDALDISRAALRATRRNAALNGVDVTLMTRLSAKRRYKLVIANLLERPFVEYASSFKTILAPDGLLYAGCFDPKLVPLYYRHGLEITDVKHTGGWKAFLWRRAPDREDQRSSGRGRPRGNTGPVLTLRTSAPPRSDVLDGSDRGP